MNTLEEYVKGWRIFMDTCSILHVSASQFWSSITPLLQRYQAKIIIPFRCLEEIGKKARQDADVNLKNRAVEAQKTIQVLFSANALDIRGEKNDNFADNVFQVVFTKFRMNYRLLLITQDNKLAKTILSLNEDQSCRAFPVHVRRLKFNGTLGEFNWGKTDKKEKFQNKNSDTSGPKFKLCTRVTTSNDTELPVHHIPEEGEQVYVNGQLIKLCKVLGNGGEGTIYSTNTDYVAKIYKKKNNTKRKYEKLKLMLHTPCQCPGVCYPVAPVQNTMREFVGFLMPAAKGKDIGKVIFTPQLSVAFPNWKKIDMVELCITILQKIQVLHSRNIILGDINPANILVVSSKEVYFVDTDSYQIEDFPCPVGKEIFTAPEIQGKHFPDFLRTIGNENFAVATLLFMLMLPGKPPYSQQGGGSLVENIRKMDFSYPLGEQTNNKTPDGCWKYMWSHLPRKVKEAFYNTFRVNCCYSTENKRLSVTQWLEIFNTYHFLLKSGKLGQQDSMSEDIYPSRYKKNLKMNYLTCRLCHKEMPENQCRDGICQDCLNEGEVCRCIKCGHDFLYTNLQKYIKKQPKPSTCYECHKQKSLIRERRTCIDCGAPFTISNDAYDWFTQKGLALPKRCKNCIQRKKEGYITYDQQYNSNGDYDDVESFSFLDFFSNIVSAVRNFFN